MLRTLLISLVTLAALTVKPAGAQRCDYATSDDTAACLRQNLQESRRRENSGRFGAWDVRCTVDRLHDSTECQASNNGLVVHRSSRFNTLAIWVIHGHSMPGTLEYIRVDKGQVWSKDEDGGSFPRAILAELRQGKTALTRSTAWPDWKTRETTVDLTGLSHVLDDMESHMRTPRATR